MNRHRPDNSVRTAPAMRTHIKMPHKNQSAFCLYMIHSLLNHYAETVNNRRVSIPYIINNYQFLHTRT